jgi:hypothetical protein
VTYPVISAFWRLRQEDWEFDISLGYIVNLCLKNPKKPKQRRFIAQLFRYLNESNGL